MQFHKPLKDAIRPQVAEAGLTSSLETGYRLSPRGEQVLPEL